MQAKPENIGIVALETYFPSTYVNQTELERHDGASEGKYTIGLGQTNMAFCGDREDIHSIALTAVHNLMEKYNIPWTAVGRLEVGTETIIDKSKSCKTVLMQLFCDHNNSDIEGIDTTNACYGGTAALSNALNWMESSSWDGRYALVVAADIAVYAVGNARPTGGCAAVAMLIGPNAPIVFDAGVRGTHMEHVYDFYKPDLSSEYPTVDGKLSVVCYLRAIDNCYQRYLKKAQARGLAIHSSDDVDYIICHSPYNKLVQKSIARLVYNDFLVDQSNPKFDSVKQFAKLGLEESYMDKDLETAFVKLSKGLYENKVVPGTLLPKELGNSYCGSLYTGVASLLGTADAGKMLNKRVVLFSYGSGLAATMFSFKVVGDISKIQENLAVRSRLDGRRRIQPQEFVQTLALRDKTHNCAPYTPSGDIATMFPSTYYLDHVDNLHRRTYRRTPTTSPCDSPTMSDR